MILVVFLFLGACAPMSPMPEPTFVQPPPLEDSDHSLPSHLELGEELLKNGHYKGAIYQFKEVLKTDPANENAKKGLELARRRIKADRDRIVQTVAQLKNIGNELYNRQDYVKAGQIWKEAVNLYYTQKDLAVQRELSLDIDEVTLKLDELVHILLDKGVLLYRQGELHAAILAWQDILLINPQQQEALDYINKARVKLKTLEHLSSNSN